MDDLLTERKIVMALLRSRGRVSNRSVCTLIIGVATALAAVLRVQRLFVPGYLRGPVGYDEGVYFGDAVRVVHGYLPYRDFVSVHPPGIIELLGPIATLSKVIGTDSAFAIARVCTALAGAAGVLVLGTIVRHRGPVVTALACLLLAVHPGSIYGANAVYLEPWLVLFCLLAVRAAFTGDELASPERLLVAGLLLGFAGSIKIWAIGPFLALAAVCIRRRRHLTRLLAGTAAGFLVSSLPFALFALTVFWHDVVVVQLARGGARTPAVLRLRFLLGVQSTRAPITTLVVAAGGVLALLAGCAVSAARRRAVRPLDGLAWGSAVIVTVMMSAPPLFKGDYATFAAPYLVLAAALAIDWSRVRALRTAHIAVMAVAIVVIASLQLRDAARTRPVRGDLAAQLRALIPAGACVVTNYPAATLTAQRFVSDDPACPPVVDTYGSGLVLNSGSPHGHLAGDFVRFWRHNYERADFLLFDGGKGIRDPGLQRYLFDRFTFLRRLRVSGHRLYLFARVRP